MLDPLETPIALIVLAGECNKTDLILDLDELSNLPGVEEVADLHDLELVMVSAGVAHAEQWFGKRLIL